MQKLCEQEIVATTQHSNTIHVYKDPIFHLPT